MCRLQAMLNRLLQDDGFRPLHRQLRDARSALPNRSASPFVSAEAPPSHNATSGHPQPLASLSPQLLKPAALEVSEAGDSATADGELRPAAALRDCALVFTVRATRYGLFYGDDGRSVQVRLL
jgi:hypothetical protein